MKHFNAKLTPCSGLEKPLKTDPEGAQAKEHQACSSLIGMLLHLVSNSHPDVAFAIHQCTGFTHLPMVSHETTIICICCYLQGTKDNGLILYPSDDLEVDWFVDADFAGLFGVKDANDPISVRSATGHVIRIAKCPLLWVSKLQQEITLSTQESECVALSTCFCDVIPIKELGLGVMQAVGLGADKLNLEDNAAALTLVTTKNMNPSNRHREAMCCWSCSHI